MKSVRCSVPEASDIPVDKICPYRFCTGVPRVTKIYALFTLPKPQLPRLSNTMQSMNTDRQTWPQPERLAAFAMNKEPQLKLSVETRNLGDVMIVHCHGRIVYRDEVAALSRLVAEVLEHSRKLVLDLSGVTSM